MIETMILHDMPYVVVTRDGEPPVAYPQAGWDFAESAPKAADVEQCDCVETAVDYYRLRKVCLHSEGSPVLSERDVRILDALIAIQDRKPRQPRHT